MNRKSKSAIVLVQSVAILLFASGKLKADMGTCGGVTTTVPFTDVGSSIFFCQIAEAFLSGLTNGTSATTYSPSDPVPREQMAAFITRTQDSSLRRGSKRAALNQWSTPQALNLGMLTDIDGGVDDSKVSDVVSDGLDLWAIAQASSHLDRVRASDGGLLATFNAPATTGVVANNRIYLAGEDTLSYIQKGSVTTLSSKFTPNLTCITFDGRYVWTGTDSGVIGKTSAVDNTIITVPGSFGSLNGMVYDGSNVWVTETGNPLGHIHRLDSNGTVTLSVTTGVDPRRPIFDGTNIWVPNNASKTVTVIRAATGAVLATLTGNGLNGPTAAAFDGQRILVTNTSGNSVSLWRAADLLPLGSISLHHPGGVDFSPVGACSDGVNFWVAAIALDPLVSSQLVRL